MAKRENNSPGSKGKSLRPALTPESRETQLISLAMDVAEEQLLNGTASSQIITHYLKLGTMKEKVELEKLALEKELVKAKTEAMQSSKHMEELYANAIASMRRYSGEPSLEDEEDNDEYFDDEYEVFDD